MRWVGGRSQGSAGYACAPADYRDRVPSIRNALASLASRAVHGLWRRAQYAGAVTAQRPGPYAFRRIGAGTRLAFPQGTIFGTPWIELGDHCVIGQEVTLAAGMWPDLDLGPEPLLTLGDGVVLGRGSHVIADVQGAVAFGDDVYCGPYVYVTSTNHSYDDPHEPVGKQWPRSAAVEIGRGSWLGAGAVILPGARLGRNVVVAAGAVVRGEVPDHAVVAGAPAKIVRRWEGERGWQPPLRTPPPVPVPHGVTPEQLLAVSEPAAGERE
ncbi:acyltransferase [Streptomyces sp. HNM0575]|uniref:acyltransferase n=1 Tax=Streptomyces sp. HNM0575 TaxID=2716338 RepID=UPI00145D70F6|nr:acyltransferase [Streptomyces sp. HNM0575]NLU73478.1 acyltransferase [Streptomyces sp. HNM0575]